MYSAFSVSLRTVLGVHHRWISQRAANEMVERGQAVKCRRRSGQPPSIRLVKQADPSLSPNSHCMLKESDVLKLAGLVKCGRNTREELAAKRDYIGDHRIIAPIVKEPV